jgi:hypothetical protein
MIAQMTIRGDFIKQGDTMLSELDVRFRDIRQGPDGYIYVLTEGRLRGPSDTDGMLLRLEPPSVEAAAASAGDLTLPEAEGRQQVMISCTRCHGIDMVVDKRRTRDEWVQVINTMIGSGMNLTDSQYENILGYLSHNLGKDSATQH